MTGFLFLAAAFWLGQGNPAAPVCEPYQLSPRYDVGGAAGTDYAMITVRNVSNKACVLAGVPEVRRYDEQGNKMEISVVGPPLSELPLGVGKETLLLEPNASATFQLASGEVPDSRPCASYVLVSLAYKSGKFRPFVVVDMNSCQSSVMLSGFVPGTPLPQ